jgi:hypothetical protein
MDRDSQIQARKVFSFLGTMGCQPCQSQSMYSSTLETSKMILLWRESTLVCSRAGHTAHLRLNDVGSCPMQPGAVTLRVTHVLPLRQSNEGQQIWVRWCHQDHSEAFVPAGPRGFHWMACQCDTIVNFHGNYCQWPLFLCSEESPDRFHLNKPYIVVAGSPFLTFMLSSVW